MRGKFVCRIEDQGLTEAKTGTPQILLKFAVLLQCNEDGTRTPVEGPMFRTCWMSLTDKTVGWVSDALKFIGFTGPPSAIDLDSANCCDLRGTECEFWVSQDGEFERWSINTPRAGKSPAEKKPLDATRTMELDALFADRFSAPSETPAQVSTEGDSGSVPF